MFIKNIIQKFIGIVFVLLFMISCSKNDENIYCNNADLKVKIYWACEYTDMLVILKDGSGKGYDPGGINALPESFRPTSSSDTVVAYVFLKAVERGFCHAYPCAPCRNTEIMCIKEHSN